MFGQQLAEQWCWVCASPPDVEVCAFCAEPDDAGARMDRAYAHDLRAALRVADWGRAGEPAWPAMEVVKALNRALRYWPVDVERRLAEAARLVRADDVDARGRLDRLGDALTPAIGRLTGDRLHEVRLVVIGPAGLASATVTLDGRGVPVPVRASSTPWWKVVGLEEAPGSDREELKELFLVAGGVLTTWPWADLYRGGPAFRDLSSSLAALVERVRPDRPRVEVVVVRQVVRWRLIDRFLSALSAGQVGRPGTVSEMLAPGGLPGRDPGAVLDDLLGPALGTAPLRRSYELEHAALNASDARPARLTLFPERTRPPKTTQVVLVGPPAPAPVLAVPVTTRGRDGGVVRLAVGASELAHGEQRTVTVELRAPGEVVLVGPDGEPLPAGTAPDGWSPVPLAPTPSLELVCLVELHSGNGGTGSAQRVAFIQGLLERLEADFGTFRSPPDAPPLRVGLVGYGIHRPESDHYLDPPWTWGFGAPGAARAKLAGWLANLPAGEASACAMVEDALASAAEFWPGDRGDRAARRVAVLVGRRPPYQSRPRRPYGDAVIQQCWRGRDFAVELGTLTRGLGVEVLAARQPPGFAPSAREAGEYAVGAWEEIARLAPTEMAPSETAPPRADGWARWPALVERLRAPLRSLPTVPLATVGADELLRERP
jgi:hypothetical protein